MSLRPLCANFELLRYQRCSFTTEQAEELAALAKEKNRITGVTYGYMGIQMVYQARRMIEEGASITCNWKSFRHRNQRRDPALLTGVGSRRYLLYI